jgi:hypothetical protein
MKHYLTSLLGAGLFALPACVQAQSTGHYPVGAEGIKGPTLPPPGVYLRDYNFGYFADSAPDVALPPGAKFDAFGYVNAPRLIWMTNLKILGANYGMDVILPFGYRQISIGTTTFTYTGLGDMQVEPLLLSWHCSRLDVAAGYAFWAPTGEFSTSNPAKLGQGFWGQMLTLGATYYLDAEKTWAVSALNRYEFNLEQRDTHITPGQDYTVEGGLSKTINAAKTIDVGVIGYYQQQVTTDHGDNTTDNRSRVFGVGPELSIAFPKSMLFLSVRYAREFAAEYRPEGNNFVLTVTKRF